MLRIPGFSTTITPKGGLTMKGSRLFFTALVAIAAFASSSVIAQQGSSSFEVLDDNAVLQGKQGDRNLIARLAQAYKDINAPVGALGRKTFAISTAALTGDDSTYRILESQLSRLTDERNAIAQKMIAMLEGVEFDGARIDPIKAELLILEAELLTRAVP